jgi:hypothetical protein
MEITSRDQWVLHRLETFYTQHPDALELLKDVLEGRSVISLRVLDWFITNYSKQHNTSYMTKDGRHIIVYLAYKSRLKAYSKTMFDPFCRWERIQFHGVSTTVGQLNCFAWAYEDEVVQYLQEHLEDVHADMDARMLSKKSSEEHNVTARRRRHELSNSATKSMKRHDVRVVVRFD